MGLIQDFPDALPHLDPAPNPDTRAAITALITAELDPAAHTTLHPSLPAYTPSFPPSLLPSLARLESGDAPDPTTGIDLTRYEALSPPDDPTDLAGYTTALRRAYASHTHLTARARSLALLEAYGKHAWLIGNDALEGVLRGLEREVAGTREAGERVDAERERAQREVEGEVRGLERRWREGVRRVVETGVAVAGVRGEVLEARRRGAE